MFCNEGGFGYLSFTNYRLLREHTRKVHQMQAMSNYDRNRCLINPQQDQLLMQSAVPSYSVVRPMGRNVGQAAVRPYQPVARQIRQSRPVFRSGATAVPGYGARYAHPVRSGAVYGAVPPVQNVMRNSRDPRQNRFVHPGAGVYQPPNYVVMQPPVQAEGHCSETSSQAPTIDEEMGEVPVVEAMESVSSSVDVMSMVKQGRFDSYY